MSEKTKNLLEFLTPHPYRTIIGTDGKWRVDEELTGDMDAVEVIEKIGIDLVWQSKGQEAR